MNTIEGILFDKDGTLCFGFAASWASWIYNTIEELSRGDEMQAMRLAQALAFDRETLAFAAHSVSIAGSVGDQVDALAPVVPQMAPEALRHYLTEAAAQADMVPAVPFEPLMEQLAAQGHKLGIATNDAELAAKTQLQAAGILDRFEFVAGYDSGYGAKPEPGMCRAFAEYLGLDPARVVMVGDSLHDLHAGRAAGMLCGWGADRRCQPRNAQPLCRCCAGRYWCAPGLVGAVVMKPAVTRPKAT